MAASPLHPTTTPPPTLMVRSLTLPPTLATAVFTPTRIRLLHPGYGEHNNVLFTLPAVDGTQTEPGLHHRTVLTAGAIVADNAFGRAYLTRDRAGRDRVEATIPLDGMLEPGNYWLQLEGYEPLQAHQTTDARGADGAATVNPSMPPPPGRPGSSTRTPHASIPDAHTQPSTSPSSPAPRAPTEYKTYPVVPSFGDWQFPHGRLPPEWKQRHPAPMPSPSAPHTSPPPSKTTRRCYITGYQMGINECHLVPKNQNAWWMNNDMRYYTREVTGLPNDEANLALLRADIHKLLDNHQIAIVPKPLTLSSSPPGQGSHASAYALAAHVLKDDDESREFCDLKYHNVAIPQSGVDRLRPEFLFVRFAWAIFSHLQTFLSSPIRRHLAITVRDETDLGSCATDLKWMNSDELTKFLAVRGVTRSGSRTRKRSSSQITQDEEDLEEVDAYQERWDRRSRSLDSTDDLDPDIRQVRENTRWYEEVGRFSQARDLRQVQIEENTRWYEEVGRHSRACDPRQAQVEENTRWYEEARLSEAGERCEVDSWDDDSDLERGRPRRKPELGSFPPEPEGMPNLSRSFTTYGSNRSSVYSAEEENRADQGNVSRTAPGYKVFGMVEGTRPDPGPSPQLEEDEVFP